MNFPYWLEVVIVLVIFIGGFLYVIWKDQGSLKIIPEAIKGFFVRLYEIFFLGIADRDVYDANKEQREADEAYKKQMKKEKK